MRATGWLIELSAVAVLGGGLLLLVAWLRLRAVALDGRPGSLRTILVAAVAWAAPLLLTVPLFSRDMFSYVAQGRLMTQGIDPYTHGVATLPGWFALGVDPQWADTPTPYGPCTCSPRRRPCSSPAGPRPSSRSRCCGRSRSPESPCWPSTRSASRASAASRPR
ncbi:polyprenol phosphomannose-dependent alpha 1,6 mannosyltransferase MptB [Rathayibacter oskolensis]|uniref:polyprenol phosphomannose-dependent alpha 1,6 mannosyltransferase MptB n=1 Tax=Rathayibacter oskolensis TaxID=1891671 RepID=UPI00265D9554|nr:polyprenol phosphomannose-dependent alpha 1,6 mannosyltransferase MptB [Rathayibacter oskolensis]WKK72185.1 polyprenol phosphomannose-dependent alpha 1,6 mannosyltransferase MptB [Rathayibacter oskolensis]